MPGSSMYRRPLSRSSAHRQSLLRNLVTSLIKHEQISTTYAKAKEAQREAEKLITLGKKNTNATRLKAQAMLHQPELYMEKIFGTLAQRYETRPGGYTRLLQCESLKDDAGKSAVLCLVDGPKDMRFEMTARALLRQSEEGLPMNEVTAVNVRKVTRFRKGGASALAQAVEKLRVGREKTRQEDQEKYEKKGERVHWTTEVPVGDSRWKEKKRGPGALVKRVIKKDQYVEVREK